MIETANPGTIHLVKSPAKLANGRTCHYAYLRYQVWDPKKGRHQPKPLASLGRTDTLDEDRVDDLVGFLKRWLQKDSALPFEALRERFKEAAPSFKILCSRDFGLRWLIEQAWAELGYKEAVEELCRGRKHEFRVDVAIFAMVLTQLVAPQSKRGMSEWPGVDLFFPEGAGLTSHRLYKAMDVLGSGYRAVEKKLSEKLREKGVETVRLVHDTTSQAFQVRYDDRERAVLEDERIDNGEGVRASVVNCPPLRLRGHSKAKRPDLPQVVLNGVIGEGHNLILHHSTLPGNTTDVTTTAATAVRLAELGYQEVEWAGDSGMNSAANRDVLRAERFDFVLGEGVTRTKVAREALKAQAKTIKHPKKPYLSYKSVVLKAGEDKDGEGEPRERLYVVRTNAKERRDALRRIDRHVARVDEILAKKDERRSEKLLGHPTFKKYVCRDGRKKDKKGRPAGKVRLDRVRLKELRKRAGRSVIGTDVTDRDPIDVDTVYRSLFEVERAFRRLKSTVKMGPVRHRRADRIRAHFMIAVMAYNLGRWLQHKSGRTLESLQRSFRNLRVQRVRVGKAEYWETVELTDDQETILDALGYDRPPKRFTVRRQ